VAVAADAVVADQLCHCGDDWLWRWSAFGFAVGLRRWCGRFGLGRFRFGANHQVPLSV
jgi:hypothetical protein